jgi:hypothetical protein
MKTLVATLALAAVVAASPAMARGMCVLSRDIVSTHSDDGRLLTVKLRDGRTLVNHLQGICTDLRYEGLAWNVPGTGEICEYEQTFKVLNSGQTCTLGKFDVAAPKPAAP